MAVIIDEVTADVQPEGENRRREAAPPAPEPKPLSRYEFQQHLRRVQRRQMRLKAD